MKVVGILFVAFTVASVAAGADREFTDVVRTISDEFHTQPVHIPLFGLVNAITYVVRPAGTKHIDLATFENLSSHDRSGRNLPEAIRNAVGRSWRPFVQSRSSRSGSEEDVFIYMREQGKEWKLLVITVERTEATVVQLLLNPSALQRWIASPLESARHHYDDGN